MVTDNYIALDKPRKTSIGVDIVKLDRIQRVYSRFAESFPKRLLAPDEYQQFKAIDPKSLDKQVRYLAKRWSAKEAFAKALGSGIGESCSFSDISILSKKSQKPSIAVSKKLYQLFRFNSVDLSWSDEQDDVVSFCMLSYDKCI